MPTEHLLPISIGVLAIAFLYSSVGHAGASGYIAVMSLFGIAPALIKPTALILNILVASLGSWQFWRMGFVSWKLFFPLAAFSIPMSFLGGYLNLPVSIFKVVFGVTLLLSAIRFLIKPTEEIAPISPAVPVTLSVGGGIGFLSGLTGTGGGIFLTPLLFWMRWASAKTASAVSALFILVNSISGLLGNLSATKQLPPFAGILLVSASIGGITGSYLGSHRLSHKIVQRLLSIVLIIAGLKLILT
jgi:uncharacterized membrane protein YfcA